MSAEVDPHVFVPCERHRDRRARRAPGVVLTLGPQFAARRKNGWQPAVLCRDCRIVKKDREPPPAPRPGGRPGRV
jgi:hypothetical protein